MNSDEKKDYFSPNINSETPFKSNYNSCNTGSNAGVCYSGSTPSDCSSGSGADF